MEPEKQSAASVRDVTLEYNQHMPDFEHEEWLKERNEQKAQRSHQLPKRPLPPADDDAARETTANKEEEDEDDDDDDESEADATNQL